MRKTHIILFLLLSYSAVFGQVTKTVNVSIAGTLNTYFTATETTTVSNLTVSGNIDARDFAYMRDKVTALTVLDLSAAKIMAYTGIDGTYTVTTIAYPANELPLCAFYNSSLFTYKYLLTSIKLPTTITSIGGSAFYYCTGLSGTFTIPASVTSIGSYALYGCSLLSAYVVDAANKRYSSNNGVLMNKSQDSLFICPSSKAGAYTIPNTVVSISASAFDGCALLTGNLIIPSSVKSIGSYAFYYCTGFTGSLTLPSSLVSIDAGAFYGCSGLIGTVTIPKAVDYIGSYAFFECNKLSSFQVDPLNKYYAAANDVLFNKAQDTLLICPGAKVGSYTVPTTVKAIGSYGFYNCSTLTGSLVIPKSVIYIGSYAFYGCTQLSAYQVDPLNTKFLTNNGVLFNKNQDSLLVCPSGKTGSYTIPPTVKNIGTYSFYYCTGLTGSINLPASVTSIGDYAFYGCNQLTAFVVDAGNPLYSSKDGVLFNRTQDSLFICPVGKTGVYDIPNSVVAVEYYAFDGCVGLTNINIPSSVTSLGKYAFEYCTGLTEITLPKSITTIGSGAFYGCSNLAKFSIINPIPPTIDYYTFLNVPQNTCQLFVAIGSKIAYQISAYWNGFTSISESSFTDTGLSTAKIDAIKIYGNNHNLMVNGLMEGDQVDVFTLDGKSVYSTKASGSNLSIPVQRNIYLVKTKEKTVKIAL